MILDLNSSFGWCKTLPFSALSASLSDAFSPKSEEFSRRGAESAELFISSNCAIRGENPSEIQCIEVLHGLVCLETKQNCYP
jgi:hypothetical protein